MTDTLAGLPPIVDTHTHLFLMEDPPAAVVAGAIEDGIAQMVCAAIDPETTDASIAIAEAHPEVFATAGMHPHTASALDEAAKRAIVSRAAHPRVVAVGETGLDYFRMHSPREEQVASLRWHVGLSNETGKPLVVHVRDAWEDVLRVLREERAERVVIHCFSGGVTEARECASRGYRISFAANVTYPKNPGLRAAATKVSRDRIVVETDSPFLPPEGLRGKENVPGNARVALLAVAEARGEDHAALAAVVTANARAAFALPVPAPDLR